MSKWQKPNPAQSDHLKSYMAEHPQLAKSNVRNDASKKTAEAMWAKLTVALNSLGPPSRDKNQRKKVIYIRVLIFLYCLIQYIINYYLDMG